MSFSALLTISELVRLHPATLPILTMSGIDPCCGGEQTLSAAAHGAGLTFDQLAARLRGGLGPDGAPLPMPPSCGCERKAS
jgi:iron-sulfur cluster repair protein YtfE (RIC family)